MTEINEKYTIELLKKRGIRTTKEEITYVHKSESGVDVGIIGSIF